MNAKEWKSEHQAVYITSEACTNESTTAGAANKVQVKNPVFFAWERTNPKKATVSVQTPAEVNEPVEEVKEETNDYVCDESNVEASTKETENVNSDNIAAPSSYVIVPPMGVYDDAMNAKGWSSEYDSMTKPCDATDSKLAGINTNSNEVSPCYYAWSDANKGAASASEYKSVFVKSQSKVARTKSSKPSNKNGAPYASDNTPSNKWSSEYDATFLKPQPAAAPAVTETAAPVTEEKVDTPIEDDFVFVEVPDVDTNEVPVSAPQAIVEEPVSAGPVVSLPIVPGSKVKKIMFTSEYNDRFQWPTAQPVLEKVPSHGPPLSMGTNSNFTTESRSNFAWPDRAMMAADAMGKKSSRKGDYRNSNVIYHVEPAAELTETVMSADSLTPALNFADNDSLTTSPPLRQCDASTVTAASSIPRTGRYMPMLTLQDSAAAERIAADTGLRIPSMVQRKQRPVSAPGAGRRKSAAIFDDFNPLLVHKRYPQNSDKQIGRWTTETKSSFTWKNKAKK
jgi:hypothetical protein